jgi:hypothetical protein
MTMERNKIIIIVCQRNRVQGPMVIINDILVGPEIEKFKGIGRARIFKRYGAQESIV